jgi:hypothetical protein
MVAVPFYKTNSIWQDSQRLSTLDLHLSGFLSDERRFMSTGQLILEAQQLSAWLEADFHPIEYNDCNEDPVNQSSICRAQ